MSEREKLYQTVRENLETAKRNHYANCICKVCNPISGSLAALSALEAGERDAAKIVRRDGLGPRESHKASCAYRDSGSDCTCSRNAATPPAPPAAEKNMEKMENGQHFADVNKMLPDLPTADLDWPTINRERGALIDKNIAGTITAQERIYLHALQAYADDHLRRFITPPAAECAVRKALADYRSGWIGLADGDADILAEIQKIDDSISAEPYCDVPREQDGECAICGGPGCPTCCEGLRAELEIERGMTRRGEQAIGKLRVLAHSLGWNGVENSKILEVFLENYVTELRTELAQHRKATEEALENLEKAEALNVFFRDGVGECHVMISRNSSEYQIRKNWEPTELPPRLQRIMQDREALAAELGRAVDALRQAKCANVVLAYDPLRSSDSGLQYSRIADEISGIIAAYAAKHGEVQRG